ncbi:MAG: hypothetical protein Q8R25_00575 [bacterium]|nr:hypothetical protein [bacterium]
MKYPKMEWGRIEAIVNKLGGEGGVDRFLAGEFVLVDPAKAKKGVKAQGPLFTFAGTFKTLGTKEFVFAKSFVINTSENARVRISYLGDRLKKHLLPKTERNIEAAELKLQKLCRSSIDLPKNAEEPGTIAGLGGLEKAETGGYEFFEALAYKQSVGDFSWTVGFARDENRVLWAVRAYWGGGGWYVGACSPSDPSDWDAGFEFLSR